jgi:exopolysaccharide biosynthesis polyprenyl glycosylphosphotransferase
MTSFRRQILLRMFIFYDVAVLGFSLCVAMLSPFARARFSLVQLLTMRVSVHSVLLIAALLYGWHWIFNFIGLYQSRRLSSQSDEMQDVLKASTLATALLALVDATLRLTSITPESIGMFWLISTSILVFSRLGMRALLRAVRERGRNLRSILVVGTNNRALAFARGIQSRPELGYRLGGFVDEQWIARDPLDGMQPAIVSDLDGFQSYLRTHVVDEVVIALPVKSFYSHASRIVALCKEQGIVVRVLSDLFNHRGAVRAGEFESNPVVTLNASRVYGWPAVLKRAIDIYVSASVLILLAPVFVLVAALIKLGSDGPALFAQQRVGLNKRRFRMYKFRTMVVNAEALQAELETRNEMSGPVFKIKDDPRITRVGRFLRKTSIDELPQLFNVLKGDMSLVGPRPLPVRDYEGFDQDWQRRRFSVRPGVTCLWQISGRSSIRFEEWMDLDMRYIDHWSLWLDVKILARTIPAVMKGSGAS